MAPQSSVLKDRSGLVSASETSFPVDGYGLRSGSTGERPILVKFMQRNYAELDDRLPLNHIAATVDRYLSRNTPIWWVAPDISPDQGSSPIACLWLGQAIDQRTGNPHPYVLLLYVDAAHRRRGIATALLETAHGWAHRQGNSQISLQVYSDNQAAQALYRKLGYQPEALLMKKTFMV
jgi:ribosomal protein S18 acetylase RimI-like enzyme